MAIVWFPSIPIVEHSDKTLMNWRKKELIEYIRHLEHSVKNLDERLDVQARNMSKYEPIVYAHKVRAHSQGGGTHFVVCSNCEKPIDCQDAYCKHCGAKMDEEVDT